MNKFSTLDWITFVLIVIGGLNWGLWGAFQWNLVEAIFGTLTSIVYVLVGLSAIYWLLMMGKLAKK